MEYPRNEVHNVIRKLTQGTPEEQEETIRRYFTPDAAFEHPFCRIPGFATKDPNLGDIESRWLLYMIYRWYRFLSPKILLDINSVCFDSTQLLLYVHISQVFSLWFVPFYRTRVYLVALLHLWQNPKNNLYYICQQEDLYPVREFMKFPLPFSGPFVDAWRSMVTIMCIVSASVCLLATSAMEVAQRFAREKWASALCKMS